MTTRPTPDPAHRFTYVAGAAQRSIHGDVAPHPAELMATMALAALSDAGIDDLALLDAIACVETVSWTYDDLAGTVLAAMGAAPDVGRLGVPPGGTSPQDLLHQMALDPTIGCAVIVGAEVVRARRRAGWRNTPPGWPPPYPGGDIWGDQAPFSSPLEQRHGLRAPIQAFPLYENAIRAAHGRSFDEQRTIAATVLARNAAVAAGNPHAWFRDAPDAESIAEITPDNRMIAYPYTKRMNAIIDVNQSAAIVVVSSRFAEAHGLTERCMAVLGGAGAVDAWNPLERATYAGSVAMEHVIGTALRRAGLRPEDLDAADLYSCFPSPIELGLAALHTDHTDARPYSLTGGLAFAGGPGNGYVLHSIAAALEHLRAHPGNRVLVTGIGMANAKHAATVLSSAAHIPPGATGEVSYRDPLDIEPVTVVPAPTGEATIVTYTIDHDREGTPSDVILILDLVDGGRTIANAADPVAMAAELMRVEPIGRRGRVHPGEDGRNLFELSTPGGTRS